MVCDDTLCKTGRLTSRGSRAGEYLSGQHTPCRFFFSWRRNILSVIDLQSILYSSGDVILGRGMTNLSITRCCLTPIQVLTLLLHRRFELVPSLHPSSLPVNLPRSPFTCGKLSDNPPDSNFSLSLSHAPHHHSNPAKHSPALDHSHRRGATGTKDPVSASSPALENCTVSVMVTLNDSEACVEWV